MEYIEELESGTIFRSSEDHYFLLTSDFKQNGSRLCYSIKNGLPQWFPSDTIVSRDTVYTLDKDHNICPIKLIQSQYPEKS